MNRLTFFLLTVLTTQGLYGADKGTSTPCNESGHRSITLEEFVMPTAHVLRSCKNTYGSYPGVVLINSSQQPTLLTTPTQNEQIGNQIMTGQDFTINGLEFTSNPGHTTFVLMLPPQQGYYHFPNIKNVRHAQIDQILSTLG